jgi:hypothetical protein
VVSRLAGIDAVNFDALTKACEFRTVGVPPQLLHQVTTELLTKFDPLTVIVIGLASPAVVLLGDMELRPAPATVNVSVLDATPLESTTSTVAEPAADRRFVGTIAISNVDVGLPVALRTCVTPPTIQLITDPAVGRFVPLIERVSGDVCPAATEVGDMPLKDGAGFTVNAAKEPSELVTPT